MNSAPHDERSTFDASTFPGVPDNVDFHPAPRLGPTGPVGCCGGPVGLPTIKDSGKREEFNTGSKRDSQDGKGRYDLLPTRALRRLARHFEAGAKKYDDRNWEKGQPLARMINSGLRHGFAHLEGQRDEDHLIAAVWNLLCAADIEERIKEGLLPAELDNLPKLPSKK